MIDLEALRRQLPGQRNVETAEEARALIGYLGAQFYQQGWVSGTGGGISVRVKDRVYIAPSGVMKEAIAPEMIYCLDMDGTVLEGPQDPRFKCSECTPLFFNAYRLRDAGAILHSHSKWATLATLISPGSHFEITHLEMIKGISGQGYHDVLRIPIIENTARESELTESMAAAMEANPDCHAVLVRRHGIYVWGSDWQAAKRHAECYDYLFQVAVEMRALGMDWCSAPA